MRNLILTSQNKMRSVLSKRASENQLKECGSGGPLVYAMCFIAFFLCIYIFIWTDYKQKIHLLKDEMEMNLHIVENYCITVNQKNGSDDAYERERERAHIITVGANNPSASDSSRKAQANEIGKVFSSQFKEIFNLTNNKPNGGLLLNMSKSNANLATMNIKEVRIYEPTYLAGSVYPVYCTTTDITHSHDENCKKKSYGTNSDAPTNFVSIQSMGQWYIYVLSFDTNNNYTGCSVTKSNTAPTLYNGSTAEGATIESTIVASFYQPEGFVKTGDKITVVEVQEAIDIVYASEDSRKQ